jgi:hypothetical protein
MTCDLHALPGSEVLVDFLPQPLDLFLDLADLGLHPEVRAVGLFAQFVELLFQLGDGFFEIQSLDLHERTF